MIKFYFLLIIICVWWSYEINELKKRNKLKDEINEDLLKIINSKDYNNDSNSD